MSNENKNSHNPAPMNGLDLLARTAVGDGKGPNFFFVTLDGRVVAVVQDPLVAYGVWKRLAKESKRLQPCLEDRVHGTIARVEPLEEGGEALGVFDDFLMYFPPYLSRSSPA